MYGSFAHHVETVTDGVAGVDAMNEKAGSAFVLHAMDNAQALIARMDNKAAGLIAVLAILESTLGIAAAIGLDTQPSKILIGVFIIHAVAAIWSMSWLLFVLFAKGKAADEQVSMCFPGDSMNFATPDDYLAAMETHDATKDYASQFLVLGSIFRAKAKAVNLATVGIAATVASWALSLALIAWVG